MEAFTKLTDKLFDEILHSTSTDLAEARRILQNITQRRFYKKKCNGLKSNLENGIQNCVREDFVLDEISMDWGMGEDNPIDHVSSLLPQRFSEKCIRVYSKKTDTETLDEAKRIFNQWCKTNNFPLFQSG
ncbi:hypothetical protein DPEC_G00005970 [Dallia pectoralis]|uniref:Uncharacterized protein n=1 Tax=Dallia pectoralis TaxID=75939 RepID=A0ACC2HKP0_DALPE|nr:hypothetical protein DPEC_G00005970 [Dallia pectoralis]